MDNSKQFNNLKFSRRLLVMPKNDSTGIIKATDNPVRLARKLISELKLYHLINEVEQARLFNAGGIKLLFKMGSIRQANTIFNSWQGSQANLISQMNVAPSDCSFFSAVCNSSQATED
ncbi:hypothetical protein AWZ03_003626 [Drosophila navojoa]|uniref:Uncharacterized protein n=2 Tax=Drosophila navojoa TaxID=7232 RepID=A0A484BP75_DRONA|nr:hypothetical protein AWZ03_003626 [Drosophila navojoa]